ncbi:DUF1934 domain-containing protein [Mycoplasma sp. P36-A1]|uniref:DUF1934 domain-containing protein n=1 Tax=Mycoplasma sp. P36-A1 TaxID=3252900 RepID=UPI003C2D5D52
MENVKVNFYSSFAQDGLNEEIKYNVDGLLDKTNYCNILHYDEYNAEDKSNTKVVVKFNKEEVIICRDGNIFQELNFCRTKQSYGTYEISGFNIKLSILLKEFEVSNNHIKLSYDLFVETHPSGSFNIDIKLGESI